MTTYFDEPSGQTASIAIGTIYAGAVIVTGLFVSLLAAGTPASMSVQIALYSTALFAAAGYGFSGLAIFGQGSTHYRMSLSLVIGISIIPTIAFATYMAGFLHLTNLVVGLLLATCFWLRPMTVERRANNLMLVHVPVVVASVLAPLGVTTLADLTGTTDHGSMQVIIAQALDQAWPPELALASGVPIAYHYGLHLILQLMSMTTGASLDAIVDTAAPTLFLWFSIWGITTIAAYWLRLSTLAYVAMAMVVFAVFGFAQPFNLLSVLRTIPFTGALTLSPLLGHLILVVSLFILVKSVESTDRLSLSASLLLLAMLGFSASIVRAGASGLLLASTASALWVYWVAVRRRLEFRPTALVFVIGVTTIVGVVVTLGLPGSFSGANFLRFSLVEGVNFIGSYENLAYKDLAAALGLPFVVTGLIGIAVSIALAAGFLSPAMWAFVFRWSKVKVESGDVGLLLSFALATVITFITVAPGASHFVINQSGYCCSAILGARGLDYWLLNRTRENPSSRPQLAWSLGVFISLVLFLIQMGAAVEKIASAGVVENLFVKRDPAQRTRLGKDLDLAPIIDRIESPSAVYFILPNTKDFDLRTTYNFIAKNHLKLLAYEGFLQYTATYGGAAAKRLDNLRRSVAAYDLQTNAGVIDLGLAKQIIESSQIHMSGRWYSVCAACRSSQTHHFLLLPKRTLFLLGSSCRTSQIYRPG